MTTGGKTLQQCAGEFHRDGYVVLRSAFGADEIDILREAIAGNAQMNERFRAVQAKFAGGKYPSFETIFCWNDTGGDDVFAKFTRSAQVFDVVEHVLEDSVYVYHNKVTLKYPNMPGFKHHQDYFYWYGMGCLYPDLATCYIAVDRATQANGCLRIVRGSHRLGRVEHALFDGVSDSAVEPARLAAILERLPEDRIEMDPGDAVVFHCNAIHASDANHSPDARLALLGCYNTRHNDPYGSGHDHPGYRAQNRVHDRVVRADLARMPDFSLSFREV